jgi:hypothetical protein
MTRLAIIGGIELFYRAGINILIFTTHVPDPPALSFLFWRLLFRIYSHLNPPCRVISWLRSEPNQQPIHTTSDALRNRFLLTGLVAGCGNVLYSSAI